MSYLPMRILTSSGLVFLKVAGVRTPVNNDTVRCGVDVRKCRSQDLSGGERQEQQ